MDFGPSRATSNSSQHNFTSTKMGAPTPAGAPPPFYWRGGGDHHHPATATTPISIDEVARDFMSNSSGGIVGEVMDLEDFLDEFSDQDKLSPAGNDTTDSSSTRIRNRYTMFNPLTNLELMFSHRYHQNQHFNYPPNHVQSQQHLASKEGASSSSSPIPGNIETLQQAKTTTTGGVGTLQRKRSQSLGSTGGPNSKPGSPYAALTMIPRPASTSMAQQDPSFDPRTRIFTEEELRPQPILRKRKKQHVSDEFKNEKYWEKRIKNNTAARKSREAKRLRENQILMRARFLEAENSRLRGELLIQTQEKDVMRQTIRQLKQTMGHKPEVVTVQPI